MTEKYNSKVQSFESFKRKNTLHVLASSLNHCICLIAIICKDVSLRYKDIKPGIGTVAFQKVPPHLYPFKVNIDTGI